jgi:ABC-type transport system involved in multi-copper enzyme maturation permease subunit
MTILPIVERELRVASRRASTQRMRVAAAVVAMAVFGWMMLTFLRGLPPTMHGRYLFRTVFSFSFVYCLLIGARLTADCLSEEKREGTLGLLFLTDLKGYDVVLGKLAATSVNSVYALMAIVPVMSLPVQLGGVTAAEVWQSALVLLNTLFFSLSAGVVVSALSRNERKAMFAAVFVILGATFLPGLLALVLSTTFPQRFDNPQGIWPILALSPGFAFALLATGANASGALATVGVPGWSFWISVLWVQVAGWGMLGVASRILPRVWQGRVANSRLDRQRERVEQWAYGRAAGRKAFRTRLLNINPFMWLVSRERWKPYYVWLYVVAGGATWWWGWYRYDDVMFDRKTVIPTVLMFQTFLKLWIISEACTRLAEDRRIGALELLLSTPLTTREILRGHWLALWRQFAWPLAVILASEFLLLRRQFALPVVLINLAMVLADVLTLGWVGMWLGLTARNLNRAIVGAIGRVLVLPWISYYTVMWTLDLLLRVSGRGPFEPTDYFQLYVWFGLGLAVNGLFGVWWARRHLLKHFRQAATQRFRSEKIGWLPRRPRSKDVAQVRATAAVS